MGSDSTSTTETTSRTASKPSKKLAEQLAAFDAHLKTQDPHLKYNRGIGGFTLRDGPWLYRIGGKESNEFNEITDNNSYQNMVKTVKQLNDPILVIIHVSATFAALTVCAPRVQQNTLTSCYF